MKLKPIKSLFKTSTRQVKKTTVAIIEGVDEGINGENAKTDRRLKRAYNNRINSFIKITWLSAWCLFLLMVALAIIVCGFSNELVSNAFSSKSIALLMPFLLAAIIQYFIHITYKFK